MVKKRNTSKTCYSQKLHPGEKVPKDESDLRYHLRYFFCLLPKDELTCLELKPWIHGFNGEYFCRTYECLFFSLAGKFFEARLLLPWRMCWEMEWRNADDRVGLSLLIGLLPIITMVQSSDSRKLEHPCGFRWFWLEGPFNRRVFGKSLMSPIVVVISKCEPWGP